MDMSMIQNNYSLDTLSRQDDAVSEDEQNLARLNRYLAILENNRKAASFVPDEALLALDMAEFVRQRLHERSLHSSPSAARMALSLVQRPIRAPMQ